MEAVSRYQEQLEAAIETRRQWLEDEQIPALKNALASFEALFEGAIGMLIRKGLLREDPYNYEQAFSDIAIPKDDVLPEFENSDEVSYRLAAYRRQLKYVSTEYPLELSTLNLARLKKLSSLISYINWLELGESTKSPTTRAFARVFMKVRMGADSMASQILKDSEVQIVRTTHLIRAILGDLISYCRESWKAEIRRIVLPGLTESAGEGRTRREEMLKGIRRGFANRMAGRPWYPTLAEEVADEELSKDAEERRAKVLASLAVTAPERPAAEAPDGRAILLDSVRLFSRPSEEFATAIAVLEENEKLLAESRSSGGGWLRRLLGTAPAAKTDDRQYKVQYADPGVRTPKTETIDFPRFITEVQKKSSLLAALSAGGGPAYHRLASTPEEQLAGFVDKQLTELLLIHRRLGCLNTMFQARVAQEKKTARGIKIELLTIKNALVKANHRRHEYKAQGAG
ncbi:MAG: hypothetical protein ACLQDL_01230 [Spirochaetia bacterium]